MKHTKYITLLLLVFASLSSTLGWAGQHVYLMAGQSNMMGLGNSRQLPSGYRQHPKNVTFIYQGRVQTLGRYSRFGPELSFAHQVSRAFPNDQHTIIKFAATGSHIQQWLPGQHYYRSMLRQLELSFQQTPPRIDAIFWMQGESDAKNSFRASRYAGKLSRFIHSLRRDIRSPHSLFIMGQVNPQSHGYPMVNVVQKGQQTVNQQVHNTQLISSHGLQKRFDKIHYNTQGQLELGRRFAAAYINHQRNIHKQPLQARLRAEILSLLRRH